MPRSRFGDLVLIDLERREMSQTQLANLTGIRKATLSKILSGNQKPAPRFVEPIVEAMKWGSGKARTARLAAARDYGFEI